MKRSILIPGALVAVLLTFFLLRRPAESPQSSATGEDRIPPPPRSPSTTPEVKSGAAAVEREVQENYARGASEIEVTFSLVGQDGEIDAATMERLGIRGTQAEALTAAYHAARSAMAEQLIARIGEDPRHSDPASSTKAYIIRADGPAGEKITSELKTKLISLLGEDLGKQAHAGMHLHQQFGCFGRQEIRLKITDSPGTELGRAFKVGFYVPDLNIRISDGTITRSDDLHRMFGKTFDSFPSEP